MRKRLFSSHRRAILATGVIAVLTAKPLPLLSDGLMALLAIHAFLSAWQLRRLDKAAGKVEISGQPPQTAVARRLSSLGLALVATVALVAIGLTHAARPRCWWRCRY